MAGRKKESVKKPSELLDGVDEMHDPRYKLDSKGDLKRVKPDGPLKAEKRELFCLMQMQGHSKAESYYKAGYKPKNKQRAAMDADQLFHCADVQARLYELKMHNGAHDEAAEARDDATISQEFVVTQMKLLLIAAKNDNSLKLARDIIKDMGKEIGMFQEANPNDPNIKALTAPHNSGNQINLSALVAIVDNDANGDRDSNQPATIIDAEVDSDSV